MSGATKGYISVALICKKPLYELKPSPTFRMISNTYSGQGTTGVRTEGMSSA